MILRCVIALCLWPSVLAASGHEQVPATLRTPLQHGRFGIVTSIRGLPLGVRDELQKLFGNSLDIAEPGAAFRAGRSLDATVPSRRLAAAACTIDLCIVYYERAGAAHTWHVAVFHWTPAATRLEFGGIAPEGLKTSDELRKAILAGAIKPSTDSW